MARYAAALISSTGTAALYLDASEATHGGIGQCAAGDVLVAVSNSGTTEELIACVRAARGLGVRIAVMSGRADSPLGQLADLHVSVRIEREAGPLGLAPRVGSMAQMLALSALSVELQEAREFGVADYNRRHPAGDLGRRSKR